jgi:hypothetical protein
MLVKRMNIPDLHCAASLSNLQVLMPAHDPSNKKLTPAWRQVHGITLHFYGAFVWAWRMALPVAGDRNLLRVEWPPHPIQEQAAAG